MLLNRPRFHTERVSVNEETVLSLWGYNESFNWYFCLVVCLGILKTMSRGSVKVEKHCSLQYEWLLVFLCNLSAGTPPWVQEKWWWTMDGDGNIKHYYHAAPNLTALVLLERKHQASTVANSCRAYSGFCVTIADASLLSLHAFKCPWVASCMDDSPILGISFSAAANAERFILPNAKTFSSQVGAAQRDTGSFFSPLRNAKNIKAVGWD